MRFYQNQHRHTCGVDLHGRNLYHCVLDEQGDVRLHKRIRCDPELFLEAIPPYRDDPIVGSDTSLASLPSRPSPPMPASSNAARNPMERLLASPGPRSAMPTSSGPSARPPSASSDMNRFLAN